jgi:hypothetical protein
MVFKQYDNYVFRLKCSFDVHATIMIFSTAENEFKFKKNVCCYIQLQEFFLTIVLLLLITNKDYSV